MPTEDQRKLFLAALQEHANPTDKRARIAQDLGVTSSMVSLWITGTNTPNPDQIFAIEKACGLPGGALSHWLGYVPVGASSVLAAIEVDETLTPIARRALAASYLVFASAVES